MPRPPRAEQFSPDEVCIVHVTQRCVRRAFLAGIDFVTGKDFSYRREWIRRRLESLASVYSVDVLTYSIMSSHVHVILRNRPDVLAKWSDIEVARRWLKVFPGHRLEEHLAEPTENDVQTLVRDTQRLKTIRQRLADISWFMRALSEPIARRANKADECTGHFWEGRFKAQRIVDETGLLACSMYVDLNPVRAAMADSPDHSPHTSAYDRIEAGKGKQINSAAFDLKPIPSEQVAESIRETPVETLRQKQRGKRKDPTRRKVRRDGWLAPLPLDPSTLASEPQVHTDGFRSSDRGFLSLSLNEYLRLLRWTAKHANDAAKLPAGVTQTLAALGIEPSMWRDLVWHWENYFGQSTCVGRSESMQADAERTGHHWHRGQSNASACFV
ncbi:transposase [Novipirellula sp.]|uniref:transposase n=1 Tax=Novipirellula sp. TaxID=2795430 RepID=UPI003569BF67